MVSRFSSLVTTRVAGSDAGPSAQHRSRQRGALSRTLRLTAAPLNAVCSLASVAALRPLLVVEHETDAATFRDRRCHELSDGLEHGFELSVVLGFERG